MLLYLSGLSLWTATILLVFLPTGAAIAGLIVSRRFFDKEHLGANNHIAGFKFATVGVIYSVLLAFSVIVVWEKFNEAEVAVEREAGAAASLYRLAAGTDPGLVAIRDALTNYLKLAIERDWPAMSEEKRSHEVRLALDALYATALRYAWDYPKQPVILVEIFKQLDEVTQARRTRLHLATGIVPTIVWLGLVSGAVLTIAFTFFFATPDLWTQVTMTGILSILVFIGLLVIVEIDHPFTGPAHVGSEPLVRIIDDFAT